MPNTTAVEPKSILTCTTKVFVITAFITMPHLNNHRVIHRDVNVTIEEVTGYRKIQTEVDVVIGGRWTRECRVDRVVAAACVSHHATQLNDVTTGRFLGVYGISRETNKFCKISSIKLHCTRCRPSMTLIVAGAVHCRVTESP